MSIALSLGLTFAVLIIFIVLKRKPWYEMLFYVLYIFSFLTLLFVINDCRDRIYPVSTRLTYILMKPLEWFFLICLYLFVNEPEKKIARQYSL